MKVRKRGLQLDPRAMNQFFLAMGLLLCLSCSVNAQSNPELIKYYQIADSAKLFENHNQLDAAIYYYKKLLGFQQFEIRNKNYENLAEIYLKQHQPDAAKYYLTQAILNAGPMDHGRFNYLTHDTINLNIDSLNNLYHFDYAIYNKIYNVFRDDQAIRKTNTILSQNKTRYDSSLRADIFRTCDSLNFIDLEQALLEIGHLPTTKEIGTRLQGSITMALMVHHLGKDPAFWESIYRKATNDGTVGRESFPLVNDYYHFGKLKDLKQNNATYLYCEYISFETPGQIPEPMDPENVDKLRAEFYLPPLYMKGKIEHLKLPQNYLINH